MLQQLLLLTVRYAIVVYRSCSCPAAPIAMKDLEVNTNVSSFSSVVLAAYDISPFAFFVCPSFLSSLSFGYVAVGFREEAGLLVDWFRNVLIRFHPAVAAG